MQKLLTFFQQTISIYLPYFKIEILTSHWLTTLLSFEQLGPVVITESVDAAEYVIKQGMPK